MVMDAIIKGIEEEIRETKQDRRLIFWIGLVTLIAVAIFVPERYALLLQGRVTKWPCLVCFQPVIVNLQDYLRVKTCRC